MVDSKTQYAAIADNFRDQLGGLWKTTEEQAEYILQHDLARVFEWSRHKPQKKYRLIKFESGMGAFGFVTGWQYCGRTLEVNDLDMWPMFFFLEPLREVFLAYHTLATSLSHNEWPDLLPSQQTYDVLWYENEYLRNNPVPEIPAHWP